MSVAIALLVAILAASTLVALRLAGWLKRRYRLSTDVVVGVFLLLVLLGWWLAGAFFAMSAALNGSLFLGLGALVYVVSATAFLLWGYKSLKKNQFSS
jgi:hypothetical protein